MFHIWLKTFILIFVFISSVQSLSHVWLFVTPWIAVRQASLSITNSQSSLRFTSIESVMPSSHLILGHPLLLLPSIPPSIKVFSNESTLRMRWPKYWSFSFSIIPSKEHPGLISFRMDLLDLLAVQGTLKSLLQHHSSKYKLIKPIDALYICECFEPSYNHSTYYKIYFKILITKSSIISISDEQLHNSYLRSSDWYNMHSWFELGIGVSLMAQWVNNSPANAGDGCSIPGSEWSPGEGNGNPLQYTCLENPHGQRSLVGYSPWGHKELDTAEQVSTAAH